MKNSLISNLLTVLGGSIALSILCCTPVYAQEEGAGGTYGYSSIDYDPSTHEMTAYGETDMDPELLPYYRPEIEANVYDQKNNSYNSSCKYSTDYETYAALTCQFDGQSGYSYTIDSGHYVLLNEYYETGCGPYNEDCYVDAVNYEYIAGLGLSDPFQTDFFGPGPTEGTLSPDEVLGESWDEASYAVPGVCNDVRDQIIAEYSTVYTVNGRNWMTGFHPGCGDFITALIWTTIYEPIIGTRYSYAALTPDQTTGAGQYAILQTTMGSGLNSLSYVMGQIFSIKSGYRNPAAEISAALKNNVRPATNSRHMVGDAADIVTNGNSTFWKQIQTNAWNLRSRPCVEPSTYSSYSHAHIDWRVYAPAQFNGGTACPLGW